MIDKATSASNIAAMLQTLKAAQTQASAGTQIAQADLSAQAIPKPSFLEAVRGAVEQVNATQLQSKSMQESFERGDDVPLTDVVMNMQKSSLAFEATLQVRNKVMRAYEDILNMPV